MAISDRFYNCLAKQCRAIPPREAVFIAFSRFFMKCNLYVRDCKADLIDRGGGKWYALIVKVSTPH